MTTPPSRELSRREQIRTFMVLAALGLPLMGLFLLMLAPGPGESPIINVKFYVICLGISWVLLGAICLAYSTYAYYRAPADSKESSLREHFKQAWLRNWQEGDFEEHM